MLFEIICLFVYTCMHVTQQDGGVVYMDKKAIQVAFGNNVKHYRTLSRKSQDDFAYMADISTVYLGELERGEKCPSIEIAYKISTALDITVAQLLDFDTGEHNLSEAFTKIKDILCEVPDRHKIRLVHVFEKFSDIYKDEFRIK